MTLFARIARAGTALLLLLPLAAAAAQEDLGWHGLAHEDSAMLFYGIAQSDQVELGFSCQARSNLVSFVYAFAPIEAVDGVAVQVLLQAGDIEVPIHTTGVRLEMDELFLLEGETALDARLIDLLSSRGTLLVFVEDGAAEYPLDGAREAAAALIETCATAVTGAAEVQTCALEAWLMDGGDAGVIRDGPSEDAAALADMPELYPGYDGMAYPTVSLTGSRDGWFRVDSVLTNLYSPEGDVITAFAGEGWVPGEALALSVESTVLHAAPAFNAAVTADLDYGTDDTLIVDRLYACSGRWVEVGGIAAGKRVRGWTQDTCESQITTCP